MEEQFEEVETINFDKLKQKKKGKKDKTQKDKIKQKEAQQLEIKERNDKKYKELLKRITEQLIKKNPDLAQNTKILLKPPQVEREGSRRTAIKNFRALCKQLDRNPQHVLNFFLEDLGCSQGAVGNKGLVIKQVLNQKNVENLFRKYICEFVQCQLCKGQKTQLVKNDKMRVWQMHCNSCKSDRSVRTIKGAEKKYEEQQTTELADNNNTNVNDGNDEDDKKQEAD